MALALVVRVVFGQLAVQVGNDAHDAVSAEAAPSDEPTDFWRNGGAAHWSLLYQRPALVQSGEDVGGGFTLAACECCPRACGAFAVQRLAGSVE